MSERDKGQPFPGGQSEYLFGTMMWTPIRLAYGLLPVLRVLQSHGVAAAPLLEAADIPRFALEEPSYRIRLEQEIEFTRLALASLQLPDAGLVVGQRYHLAMFGVLGLAAASAASTCELFRIMLAYPALAWGLNEVSGWRDGNCGHLVFDERSTFTDCGSFFVDRDMTCALTLLRDALGAQVGPYAVTVRHEPPADRTGYTEFFGCAVSFGAVDNLLCFDAATWHAQPPQADEMSLRFFENQCRRISEVLQQSLAYTDIVRHRLRWATPMPSLSDVAQSLHLTTRTVQRRLAAEGEQYSGLLREVRRERASELLARGNLALDEIAWRLGFRDAVAFSHAFKRWMGVSPSVYREIAAMRRTPM